MVKRKFLTLPGLEIRPFGHSARSQSLYQLRYPSFVNISCALYFEIYPIIKVTQLVSTTTKLWTNHTYTVFRTAVNINCKDIQLITTTKKKRRFAHNFYILWGSNNRCKTKSLHCPQLNHHDADGLAGHKTWRTAHRPWGDTNAYSSRYFNILYMGPLFYREFCWFYKFYIFYIYIQFDNMY
jgi:hypothetical protein